MFESMRLDLRYAVRMIRRSPAFAAMAVVSLALGIGANTAIFTLIDAVMLRPLPVRAPEELVAVGDASRPTALWEGGPMVEVLSYPMYERLRERSQSFSGMAASGRTGRVEMRVDDGADEEVRGRLVSENYFDVLGVMPVAGRTFAPSEDPIAGAAARAAAGAGATPVIVISHSFWETRFARDLGVLGRTISLNGSPFTVIGVGPRGFTGEVVGSPTDIWIPLSMQAQVNPGRARLDRRDANWLLALGRLKPGVSIDRARAEMTLLAQEALIDFTGVSGAPSSDALREIRQQRIPVESGARGFSWIRKNTSTMLFTLMGVVGLVLVIACANVANLLLARATSRQKEIAVRLAVGASRARIVRQLLAESAVLAVMGGVAGLWLAGWGSRLLSQLAARGGPNPVPFEVDVAPNVAVLTFTATLSLLTAMLFGLVPALRTTRRALSPSLKDGARSLDRRGWPLGNLLVIGQLALSVPLLIGAGLFVRSLAHLETLDVGYSRDRLVLLQADLTASGQVTSAQQQAQTRTLLERLQTIPGVRGVTVSENGLFSGTDSSTDSLRVDGFQPARPADASARFDQVGPHYFGVIGVPVVAGREFNERDIPSAPDVAVINDTMAHFYFGQSDPLGKTLQNGGDSYTIIGVVQNSRQRDLKGQPERRFYLPLLQSDDRLAAVHFAIRTHDEATRMIPTLRRELQTFDRGLKVSSLESVRTLMSQSLSGDRSLAQLSGFFSVLALLLAAAGLYGVMSYATSRRASEIGLRMALGADRSDVIRMILRETLLLMAAGLALGLPAALAVTRLTASTLVGVSATDPAVVAGALLVMLVAGVAAGLVPAVRAARVDPIAALRDTLR